MPLKKRTEFLDLFFQGRSKEEFIALRAIKGKNDLDGSWYFTSIGELNAKISKVKEGSNVYFGVCSRSKASPNKNDVGTGYAVWVDLDLGSQYLNEKRKILAELDFLYEPSVVIDSGNGLHLYWLLDEPTSDLKLLERTCRNFGLYSGGDDVWDRARIMRAPDTLNVKEGPPGLQVEVLDDLSSYTRYSLQDLFAISCIDAKIVKRIVSGSSKGFKSRSHRDWSVVVALIRCGADDDFITLLFNKYPIGDKAQENNTYLAHTLKKARQQFDDEVSPNSDGKKTTIQENDCAWFIDRSGKKKQLSTYVFHPHTMIRSNDGSADIFVGTVCTQFGTEYPNIRFPQTAFSTSSSMSEVLPFMDCTWLGTDSETRQIVPHLFNQFRDVGGVSKELRKYTGFYKDHWVGTSQIVSKAVGGIVPEEDSLITYDQRKDEGGITRQEYDFEVDTSEQFRKFFELITEINCSEVVSIAMGWLASSIFKSRLENLGYRFPFLNISGTRGAGKTTLIKEIMQPLVGYVEPRTYDCSTTKFVMLSLLGASTDIFISLSEFRQSALSDTNQRNLQRYLLLGYDSGVDPRGRSDQTIKNYTLSAPLTLDGEDSIDDPALLERSIHVRMLPDDILGRAEEAFKEIIDLNLNQIGSQMILHSLNFDLEEELLWTEKFCRDIYDNKLDITVPSRPGRNVTLVLLGVRFLKSLAEHLGCPPPEFMFYHDLIVHCLGSVIDMSSGRTRRAVDDFIEDVVSEAGRMLSDFGSTSFAFKYNDNEQVLRFHLTTAYSWWRKHRRQQGLQCLEKRSIEAQLHETQKSDTVGYVLDSKRILIEGVPTLCYGINMTEAAKVLDIPEALVKVNIRLA